MPHMLLQNLIPQLPSFPVLLIYIGSMLGTILLCYAIFLEKEYKQDLALVIGAALLFIYAWYIKNIFFMISMGGLCIAALVEYTDIMIGKHKHTGEEIKEYKENL